MKVTAAQARAVSALRSIIAEKDISWPRSTNRATTFTVPALDTETVFNGISVSSILVPEVTSDVHTLQDMWARLEFHFTNPEDIEPEELWEHKSMHELRDWSQANPTKFLWGMPYRKVADEVKAEIPDLGIGVGEGHVMPFQKEVLAPRRVSVRDWHFQICYVALADRPDAQEALCALRAVSNRPIAYAYPWLNPKQPRPPTQLLEEIVFKRQYPLMGLFSALVPKYMTSTAFRIRFGDPKRSIEHPTKNARQSLYDRLQLISLVG